MHLIEAMKTAGCRRPGQAGPRVPFVLLLRNWYGLVSSMADRLASRAAQGPVTPCGTRTARPEQIHRIC
ncbi:MAG TPA: hypothetical protein PLT09_10580 [Deltaproteobacteria bacterium]|nr:hypothetical protein [Deltaproteobacteria bacterium]HXK47881.1 hypothetical protein [Deltaproteobacteria bacterium]